MEEITETREVLLQSDEALDSLLKVTGQKLMNLEKTSPNDVETRVRFKEMERSAITMKKHIRDILQNMK
ncbi:MAG: hypothetical protein IT242_03950 [Bacteroidia bacterium]|nr:hypothetical protein [Bacteroidia bacterium]